MREECGAVLVAGVGDGLVRFIESCGKGSC